MARGVSGRTWKLIGLAGLAGVTATGVALARNERRRRAYTPDEVRARLHARYAEAEAAAPAGAAAAPRPGPGAEPESPVASALADPALVARHETAAWAGYYRREWSRVLRGALGMVREWFGTTRPQTARATWYLVRAMRAWAPFPDNDPDAARALMERFYRVVAARGWPVDPPEAARLEVAWWAAHRVAQHQGSDGVTGGDGADLVAALGDLYAHVHARPVHLMLPAARYRAAAMRHCDAWVRDGCREGDPRLAQVEAQLGLSFTALRDAVRS